MGFSSHLTKIFNALPLALRPKGMHRLTQKPSERLHADWQKTQKTGVSEHIISKTELQMLATDLLEDIATGKFPLPVPSNTQKPRSLYRNDTTCIHLAILKLTGFDLIRGATRNGNSKLPIPSPQHELDAKAILAAATLAYLTGYKLPLNQNDFFVPAFSEWITLASAQIAHEATLLPSLSDGSYYKAQRQRRIKSSINTPLRKTYEGAETMPSTPPNEEESRDHLSSTLVSAQPY